MKQDPALTARLRSICAKFPTSGDAARAAGITTAQLRNYLVRGQQPNLTVAARLCREAGVSLEWLALGVRSEHERACLAAAIALVDATLAATETVIDSKAKADLVLVVLELERETSQGAMGEHLERIIRALH